MTSEALTFYRGRRIVVTGGASFIGSHLVELLVKYGARVTVADDLSSGRLEHLSGVMDRIEFRHGNLREASFAAGAMVGASVVFHLAAAHGGRGYIESHPVECVGNMALDNTVFSAAADAGVGKIVFASSACVYPVGLQASEDHRLLLAEDDANFEETGKAYADGEYGWAKLMGELQLRAFHKQLGITGIACRIFTAYGERENESHAVVALIAKAEARMDPFPVWGDGLQTRNFTYVADTVMGLALGGAILDGYHAVNVGTSEHHSVLELMETIFDAARWRPRAIHRELARPVGVRSRAADNSRSVQLLGWSANHPLADGVARTMRWYRTARAGQPRTDLEHRLMERA